MVAALGQELTMSVTVRPPSLPAGIAPMPQPFPGMHVGLQLGPQVPLRNRPGEDEVDDADNLD